MFPNSSSNSITATYCEFFKIFAIHIPPNGSSLILFKLQFKCHFLSLSSNVIFSKKYEKMDKVVPLRIQGAWCMGQGYPVFGEGLAGFSRGSLALFGLTAVT